MIMDDKDRRICALEAQVANLVELCRELHRGQTALAEKLALCKVPAGDGDRVLERDMTGEPMQKKKPAPYRVVFQLTDCQFGGEHKYPEGQAQAQCLVCGRWKEP